jgi:hypothetical protein
MRKRAEFGGQIDNSDLSASDLPSRGAPWDAIQKFALTFDWYRRSGSCARCAEIANSRKHDTLSNLRTCLFFEQRRWSHFGAPPDTETLSYLHGIIEEIRDKVSTQQFD